ncbi:MULTISPECIES: amidohydrolase family protein [Sphingobium]|uniref:amidohydrolase family protein n=1 Tax=Sphingobium sp. MI1205 TaxID=407020 RepID=UPI0007702E2C|nr:amidohydrolase family protein [Sphingobium sp. MI1205]AMK16885.1 amidohydrolase 2 [Sphingobium sp. MI1205]
MPVIDVDAHFHEPFDWMDKHFPKLAAKLPGFDMSARIGDLIAGEFIAQIPKDARPDPADVMPEVFKQFLDQLPQGPVSGTVLERCIEDMSEEAGGPFRKCVREPGSVDSDDRIAVMDDQGIDVQFINPSFGLIPADRALNELGSKTLQMECIAAYNSWTSDVVHQHRDRLLPVTYVVLDDVDWALAEMKRARALGSRAFHVPAQPVGGRSLAHPDFEPVWALAEDLGMALIFHVAFSGQTTLADGWGNAGPNLLASMMTYRSQHFQVPTAALTALIFGGVFERYPRLVAMSQELDTDWLPYWLKTIDSICEKNVFSRTSPYTLPLKPSEYVQRNIFVSGLPTPLMQLQPAFDSVPTGILTFATDYPHLEGGPISNARQFYEEELANYSDHVKAEFFGNAVQRAMAL